MSEQKYVIRRTRVVDGKEVREYFANHVTCEFLPGLSNALRYGSRAHARWLAGHYGAKAYRLRGAGRSRVNELEAGSVVTTAAKWNELVIERDAARAEVERLTKEREWVDLRCQALVETVREARAEQREADAKVCLDIADDWERRDMLEFAGVTRACADAIRAGKPAASEASVVCNDDASALDHDVRHMYGGAFYSFAECPRCQKALVPASALQAAEKRIAELEAEVNRELAMRLEVTKERIAALDDCEAKDRRIAELEAHLLDCVTLADARRIADEARATARRAAIEECARVCKARAENWDRSSSPFSEAKRLEAGHCAERIRTLLTTPKADDGKVTLKQCDAPACCAPHGHAGGHDWAHAAGCGCDTCRARTADEGKRAP